MVSYSVFIDKRTFLKSPLGSSSSTIIICRRERREGRREGGREGGRGGREGREGEGREGEMGRVKVMANFALMQDPTEKPHFDLKAPLRSPRSST